MTRPVLVVGAAPHAGGDLVASVLARHPGLHRPAVAVERDLALGAERIVQGAEDVARRSAVQGAGVDDLLARLGREVLAWLADHSGTPAGSRLVTLLGPPGRLTALTRLAVGADLVLVVRDGRDVVGAARRDGTSFERALRTWLSGARAILAVVGRPLPPGVRVRLVRHEELVTHPTATVGSLVAWLGLEASPDLTDGGPAIAGAGAADSAALTPLEEARFALRAATEMRALGYTVPARPTPAAAAVEAGYAVRRLAGRLLT